MSAFASESCENKTSNEIMEEFKKTFCGSMQENIGSDISELKRGNFCDGITSYKKVFKSYISYKVKQIGSGTYNNVYEAACATNPKSKVILRVGTNSIFKDAEQVFAQKDGYSPSEYKEVINEVTDGLKEQEQSLRNALTMSDANLGPKIYEAIVLVDGHVSMVMEKFEMDLSRFLETIKNYNKTDRELVYDELARQTETIIAGIVDNNLFCVDIKAANAVVNITSPPDVSPPTFVLRFIDFDADYCTPVNNTYDKYKDALEGKDKKFLAIFLMAYFANQLYNWQHANFLYKSMRRLLRDGKDLEYFKLLLDDPNISFMTNHYFTKILKADGSGANTVAFDDKLFVQRAFCFNAVESAISDCKARIPLVGDSAVGGQKKYRRRHTHKKKLKNRR